MDGKRCEKVSCVRHENGKIVCGGCQDKFDNQVQYWAHFTAKIAPIPIEPPRQLWDQEPS